LTNSKNYFKYDDIIHKKEEQPLRDKIGKFVDTIDTLKLTQRSIYANSLILGEAGAGKTNLACRIRNFIIDSGIPTIYLDFSNSHESEIEIRYKDEHFNYIRFEESEEFMERFMELVRAKKHIYMATDPNFFATKKDIKSVLTQTIQIKELLDNYYYFFHDIENLNGFYTRFEDFLLYMLTFLNLKKYGFTFLAQPHSTFENAQLKLLFTFLYIGKSTNFEYFNTNILKNMPKNRFVYQHRTDHKTLLFNEVNTNIVEIDEYRIDE